MSDKWYGGIEAGGTKFVCAVARDPDNIYAETRFPTTKPEETIGRAIEFFQSCDVPLESIGIASFGPVDVNVDSETWGNILKTPKPHWTDSSFGRVVQTELNLPVTFDSDVNGAALGEGTWGAAQGLDTFVYYTIGTGIGGGGMLSGKLMHGLLHPEMGHMRIPHARERDPFDGVCPFHGDCFEGLASGTAMGKRWGVPAETLPADHPAWELEAETIALALVNTICMLSPQRIIMGGGVMNNHALFPMIRKRVQELLNGYIHMPQIVENIDDYIVPPGLGNRAGVMGAIALAQSGTISD